ncbi:MAG: DNA translocase FtsK 4TM domain-containing protein [Clostridia bacterium]|nr:DNA translocase FtsK 4TM domain-containing protein [Clostridia bacterium]
MDQESKNLDNGTAKKASSAQAPEMENLLDDFGGRHSAPPEGKPKEPTPARPKASASSASKAASEKKAETSSTSERRTASTAPARAKQTVSSARPADSDKKKAKSASRASTAAAEKSKKAEKPKKPQAKETKKECGSEHPRSACALHQTVPYVLIVLAVLIGVSLVLNFFCNPGNKLESNPSLHLMGQVGYWICYGLFGTFGAAVVVLPLLMLNLSFFWKKYVDNRLAISKIVASLIFLVSLSALVHVFALTGLAPEMRDLSASELLYHGARMEGGGLIGGGLGFFLYTYMRWVGSIILLIALLAASLFFCLGMTPHHLWNLYRVRRAERRARKQSGLSKRDAEEARDKAELEEKLRRKTNGTQTSIDNATEGTAPGGAVEIVDAAMRKSDRLAPMPMPLLDPTDGTRPFVPTDVSRKLAEDAPATPVSPSPAAAQRPAAAPATAAAAQRPVTVTANAQRPATVTAQRPTSQTASPAPAANPTPTPSAQTNPAIKRNETAAIDPIFPKSAEARQARKIPRADRNFDLKNVFIDLDDANDRPATRVHAELPPEAPMPGSPVRRPAPTGASTATRTAAQRPAAASGAAAPRPATATATRPATASGASATARPAAPSTARPAAASAVKKPATLSSVAAANQPRSAAQVTRNGVHRIDTSADQQFGLSDEEFEKLEASRAVPKKPGEAKAAPAAAKTPAARMVATTASKPLTKTKKYVFPPVDYLHEAVPMTQENVAEIAETVHQLEETLQNFHVNIKDIQYACGPTATRYEVFPAPGVRVRSFLNLSDDIALALAAGGIRMEAPIPGKSAVGIEVPNKNRATVYLRELVDSKSFKTASSKLTACLGLDIAGKPLLFDIAKMPHLLVAGTTGSGKSVCINCTIISILYKAKPDEVKLVLIDPKKVEFSIYKNIPHLMAPIVTTPKDAAGALQAAVEEMERRFEVFEQVGVHDLKGYNEITKNDPDMPFLPQIVIIIDELADLMMTAPDEVETAICRIAQKARAAGMHLIVGTQRPSVDVVTGLIKSNIPSRIAFTVASQVDSKTILDYAGAEKLAGRGDMLFAPIGALKPSRVQGAFVDEKEVERICDFVRANNGTAQYDEKFISKLKELAAQCGAKKGGGAASSGDSLPSGSDKDGDSKYADAVRVAIEEKRVSTSLLQRKLEIGYGRAAKIIDRMQAEGIVSPPDGAKPRTILITPEEYMERFMNGDGDSSAEEK